MSGSERHDRLLGWVARTHRLVATDRGRRSLSGLTSGLRSPLTVSMASMLETGQRRWTPHAIAAYGEALGPGASMLTRAYVDTEIGSHSAGLLSAQRRADLLDAATESGRGVTATDLIEVVRWVTERTDPLGRSSWESLVRHCVDRACDLKGLVAESCDQALLPLATHPIAGRIFYDYYEQVASEVGHPKAFVPVIALQADGAQVDLSRLVSELESPNNRWLIREHLNLAAAQVSHRTPELKEGMRSRVQGAAFDWLVDGRSEHEVRRAAARVLHESGSSQTGAVKRVRLADDVARIASGMPPGTAIKLVQPDAVQVLDELGQTRGADLPHDTVLVELLSECIFGLSDHERREATRWLRFSAYSSTLALQARRRIGAARGSDYDSGRLRSWIRLLGKLGLDDEDSETLLDLAQQPLASVATKETALWAVCDLAPIALACRTSENWQVVLDGLPQMSRATMQRAIISALGRAGQWLTLTELQRLLPEAEAERIWWLSRRAPSLWPTATD